MRSYTLLIVLFCCQPCFAAPAGTGFTYQGELQFGGSNANGTYDFSFELYDSLESGNMIGSAVQIDDVTVVNGVFTVKLDFGSAPFDGDAVWLQISVRENEDPFVELTPRQEVTPVPYAIRALNGTPSDETVWTLSGSMGINSENGGTQRMDLLQVPYGIDLRFKSLTMALEDTNESPPTPHRVRVQAFLVHQSDLTETGICPGVSGGGAPDGIFIYPIGTSVLTLGQTLHLSLDNHLSPNWEYLAAFAAVAGIPEPIEQYTTCFYYDSSGTMGEAHEFQTYFSVEDHGQAFSLIDYWIGLVTAR